MFLPYCFSPLMGGTQPSFVMAFHPNILSPTSHRTYNIHRDHDPRTPGRHTRKHTPVLLQSSSSEDEEDWRNFRAKLVMQYRNSNDNSGLGVDEMAASPSTSTTTSWAYESGQTIEKGSIILARNVDDDDEEDGDSDSGLTQQYFHKAIILVLGEWRIGTFLYMQDVNVRID